MSWFTGVVVYLLTWWVLLFAVLPFGTHPVENADDVSGWRGAPQHPRMGRKVLMTSLVAAVVWLGIYALMTSGWLSFRHGWLAMHDH
ncbi:MAG TPA: DUF1467 family protein [Acetobacteraceae bacterium]|nr:DUF1467 family protein [Acetobacteraceae bacterium]